MDKETNVEDFYHLELAWTKVFYLELKPLVLLTQVIYLEFIVRFKTLKKSSKLILSVHTWLIYLIWFNRLEVQVESINDMPPFLIFLRS